MKNKKKGLKVPRFRTPEHSMAQCVNSELLTDRNRYLTLPCDVPLATKSARLPPEAFRAKPEKRSLDFADVVTSGSAALPWKSLGAVSINNHSADTGLAMELQAYNVSPNKLGNARVSECLQDGNLFAYQNVTTMAEDTWYVGLQFFKDSKS